MEWNSHCRFLMRLVLDDVEADSGGETEAGTIQRDVIRIGVVAISVSFHVTQKWLRKLTWYKKQKKLLWIILTQKLQR